MKRLLLSLGMSLLFLSGTTNLQAQWFNGPATISPAAPLDCDMISVTFDWTLGCINWNLTGYGHSIVGDTIYVDVMIQGFPICAGALSFYMHTENIGMVPAGNYTLKLRSFVSGVPSNSQTQPLVIGSCCTVNSGFVENSLQICPGDSLTFFAADTSLLTYTWKVDGTAVSTATQMGQVFNQAGTYTISLATADSSCADSTVKTLVVANPQIALNQQTDESCPGMNDGEIDISVSSGLAPYSFSWSNGATTEDLTQVPAGNYTVFVTDSIGCMTSQNYTLSAGVAVNAGFLTSDTLVCQGAVVSFTNTSNGAMTYSWYIAGTLVDNNTNTSVVMNFPGTFDVSLIAANTTCSDTITDFVVVSPPPDLLANSTDETCTGSNDGMIDLMPSGGFMPYTYSWSNGAMTEDISQLSAGNYTITITDSLGCVNSHTFGVSLGQGITASFTHTDSTAICQGETVDFTNTSTPGADLTWLNNGSLFSQNSNPSLIFSDTGQFWVQLIIVDSVCIDSTDLTFTVTAPPTTDPLIMDINCPGDDNGAIDLSLTGGTMPFTYTWSTGASTAGISDLSPGSYSVEIGDGVGCTVLDTFEVALLGGLNAAFSSQTGGNFVQFTDESDTTAVSWAWDFGDGNTSTMQNPLHNYAVFGSYQVCLIVTDAFGCTDEKCEDVEISTAIDPDLLIPLNIYPNPTKGLVQIELPGQIRSEWTLKLYDASGKLLLHQRGLPAQIVVVDLNRFSAGMYQILLESDGAYFGGKILKE